MHPDKNKIYFAAMAIIARGLHHYSGIDRSRNEIEKGLYTYIGDFCFHIRSLQELSTNSILWFERLENLELMFRSAQFDLVNADKKILKWLRKNIPHETDKINDTANMIKQMETGSLYPQKEQTLYPPYNQTATQYKEDDYLYKYINIWTSKFLHAHEASILILPTSAFEDEDGLAGQPVIKRLMEMAEIARSEFRTLLWAINNKHGDLIKEIEESGFIIPIEYKSGPQKAA